MLFSFSLLLYYLFRGIDIKPIPDSKEPNAPTMHEIPISPNIISPIRIPMMPRIISKMPITFVSLSHHLSDLDTFPI